VIDLFPLHWMPRRIYQMIANGRVNGRYGGGRYAGQRPFAVGHTLGATMMIKREAIEATGLFDEQFFMYVEEVDWSMRIHRAGFRIYCEPRAVVTHLGGQSTTQVRGQSLLNLWTSRFRFFQKYYAPWRLGLARWLVRRGAALQIQQAAFTIEDESQRQDVIDAWQTIGRM
jgi:GT2 family glycosyltransferase